MSRRIHRCIPTAAAVSGVLVGMLALSSSCHAGGAAVLMPADDRDVPEGSQIPEHRIAETEAMVKAYKEGMEARQQAEQRERTPQAEPPEPKVPKND